MSVANIDIVLNEKITNSFGKIEKDSHRREALRDFQKLGLPTNKTEEYRFTPITRNLEKKFNFDQANLNDSKNISINQFLIPNLDATVVVVVNGLFSKELSQLNGDKNEMTISSLASAIENKEALPYFSEYLKTSTDAFAALNSALWQDGIFIHVHAKKIIHKPIVILHVNDAEKSQAVAHSKMVVVIEPESELTLIEQSCSIGEHAIFHTLSEEIIVKENASLHYVKIQNDEGQLCQVTNTHIHQDKKSKLNTFTLTLRGMLIRNNLSIAIDGENCESHFYGLYLINATTLADNHTVVDHLKPNSFSNELYKGVMDGNAKGVFNGKIFVRPFAQKTNAFQSNENIILTDTASIHSKPQLEIWADDVKCSHGCTTGQLNEEALFYIRSRGIPLIEAKAMLLYAFAIETLTGIQNPILKSYLDALISQRLSKFDLQK